jgi:hypothetical protein
MNSDRIMPRLYTLPKIKRPAGMALIPAGLERGKIKQQPYDYGAQPPEYAQLESANQMLYFP